MIPAVAAAIKAPKWLGLGKKKRAKNEEQLREDLFEKVMTEILPSQIDIIKKTPGGVNGFLEKHNLTTEEAQMKYFNQMEKQGLIPDSIKKKYQDLGYNSMGDYVSSGGGNLPKGVNEQLDNVAKTIDVKEEYWNEFKEKMENSLANFPTYEIPKAATEMIAAIKDIGNKIQSEYLSGSSALKGTLEDNISKGIDAYTENFDKAISEVEKGGSAQIKSYQDAFNVAKETAGNILNIGITGADTQRGLAEELRQSSDASTKVGLGASDEFLNIYKNLAATEDPSVKYQKDFLGEQQAGAVNRIKELGGGRAGSLSSISSMYGKGQQSLQELAMQAANYKVQRQMDLANAYQTYSAQQADIYSRQQNSIINRAGIESGATNMEMGAQQTAGNMQVQAGQQLGDVQNLYGQNLANMYSTKGAGLSNLEQQNLQTRLNTQQQATGMNVTGMGANLQAQTQAGQLGASYEDQLFQMNQMNPYMANQAYYNDMMTTMNPFNDQMNLAYDTAGLEQGAYQAEMARQADAAKARQESQANVIGSVIGLGGNLASAGLGLLGNNNSLNDAIV